ncbi:hypothetical protein OCH7691_00882 [Oceanibacterium hippocampi]|uniref:Glycosyltransferase RgtA/B/C/D-like domain-containing protein n=2 Tax=Oceanibacterium hippocampi TaxID=745714 RepID=A0A1Y5RYD7_9PROT|nr:hypothetical protein OCH7691_00882 [Oceanibacterium hippocampi]
MLATLLRPLSWIVPVLTYLAMMVVRDLYVVEGINPDFISYYQNATHWLAGNTGLAVSGYWGVMYSWIMAVALLVTRDPMTVGWGVLGFTGLCLILAGEIYLRIVGVRPRYRLLAGIALALFSAYWASNQLTPDLLLGSFVVFGGGLYILALRRHSIAMAILAGLVLGVAYLCKTPGLLFAFGIIVGFAIMVLVTRERGLGAVLKIALPALLAMAVVAGPWILVLSNHYGHFTWTTAIERNQGQAIGIEHPNFTEFHKPRDGRITSWEDPSEFGGTGGMIAPEKKPGLVSVLAENVLYAHGVLTSGGWFLLTVGALFALLFHGPGGPRLLAEPWRFGIFGAAIVLLPYMVSYAAQERYYMAAYPFLLGATFGAVQWGEKAGLLSWRLFGFLPAWLPRLLLTLVVAVFLWAPELIRAREIGTRPDGAPAHGAYRQSASLARALDGIGAEGPYAEIGNVNRLSLNAAFATGRQFYGAELDADHLDRARALGVGVLIVDPAFAGRVAADPAWREVSGQLPEPLLAIPAGHARIFVPAG